MAFNPREILLTLRGGKTPRAPMHNYSPEGGGISDTIPLPSGGRMKLYVTRPRAPGFEGGHPEVSWELDTATDQAIKEGRLSARTVARESINAVADRLRAHANQHGISAYTFTPISQSRRRLNRGMAERRMKDYKYISNAERTEPVRDPVTGERFPMNYTTASDILVQSPSLARDIALGLAGTAPIGALALALTEEGQEFLSPRDTERRRRPDDFLSGDPR